MTVGPCGYGRYNDDPEHVGCPRARSDMTPCIARDGCSSLADDQTCVSDDQTCVYCNLTPRSLLNALKQAGVDVDIRPNPNGAADQLRDVVRRVTEPGVLK
jgi:hypothetical protein